MPDKELKHYEVIVRVPRLLVLKLRAKTKSEINQNLDREQLAKVIDYGDWLYTEAELDIYDSGYEPMDTWATVEEFNSGDYLRSY